VVLLLLAAVWRRCALVADRHAGGETAADAALSGRDARPAAGRADGGAGQRRLRQPQMTAQEMEARARVAKRAADGQRYLKPRENNVTPAPGAGRP